MPICNLIEDANPQVHASKKIDDLPRRPPNKLARPPRIG